MNGSSIPIIAFTFTVLVVSVIFHLSIQKYGKAVATSAILSGILFQIVGYIFVGYLDPFFIIALVITTGIAAIISAIVGIPFKMHREKR